jgi:hypothetical protein
MQQVGLSPRAAHNPVYEFEIASRNQQCQHQNRSARFRQKADGSQGRSRYCKEQRRRDLKEQRGQAKRAGETGSTERDQPRQSDCPPDERACDSQPGRDQFEYRNIKLTGAAKVPVRPVLYMTDDNLPDGSGSRRLLRQFVSGCLGVARVHFSRRSDTRAPTGQESPTPP